MKKIIWTSVIAGIMQIQAGAMELPEDSASGNPFRAYTEALRNLERDLFHHEDLMNELLPVSHLMAQLFLNMKDLTSRMIELTSAGIRVQEDLRNQLAISKDRIETLEERIAALEAAAVEKLYEEKTQRLTESQKKPMLQEESRVEGIREKQILADYGDANVEESFYLSKLHYEGGVKSINGKLFAEGSGHFKADFLFIKGNFLQNRLDLSNVEISTQSRKLVIDLWMSGYFSMEKIKNFQSVDCDRKKAWFKMPDRSKYIFSHNLIQYVTPDGQISNFVPEE